MAYPLLVVTVQQRFITAAEFIRLPDPDSVRRELDEGWVVEPGPSDPLRERCRATIAEALRTFAAAHALGDVRTETAFYLGTGPETGRDIVRTPDLAFLASRPGLPEERLVRLIHRPPDLAVEVLARAGRPLPLLKKVRQYFDAGVARVWLVDLEAESVAVLSPPFSLRELALGDDLTGDDAGFRGPGFVLPLDLLFPRD